MKTSDFSSEEKTAQYGKMPLSHRFVVYPGLLEHMGSLEERHVLDLGCGDGRLVRMMLEKGATVEGIDTSSRWIDQCKKNFVGEKGVGFHVADGADLSLFSDASFDVVVMNMVLINIPDKTTIQRIFKEVSRVLRGDGRLLFTVLHPLTVMGEESLTENHVLGEGFSYFNDGSPFTSHVMMSDESVVELKDMHWTLETITSLLDDAGLVTFRLVEPEPVEDAPDIFKDYERPEYLIFCCRHG